MVKKYIFLLYILIHSQYSFIAQNITLQGVIVDINLEQPIDQAEIFTETSKASIYSNEKGFFNLEFKKSENNHVVITISKEGYNTVKLPINYNDQLIIDLGIIYLKKNFENEHKFTVIDLANLEDSQDQDQIVLQATRDILIQSAAFNWSSSFFKLRGLASKNRSILVNNIELNQLSNYRAEWNSWSGLNDIIKNQENTNYINSNNNSFGNLNGITNFTIEANQYSKTKKASISTTNRSYQGRFMYTQTSGLKRNGWANSFSLVGRTAIQGYNEGTNYDSFSFYGSVFKQLNTKHSLCFTSIYTPTIRGKTSANTQEVFDLKGRKYNAYWGFQEGDIRNSRIKTVKTPIFTLSHQFKFNDQLKSKNTILVKTGSIKNSRIDYNGTEKISVDGINYYLGTGTNPDPTYYQKLPSYFLREGANQDYTSAYLAQNEFINEGQINWESLYNTNYNTNYSTYILYDDVIKDNLYAINNATSLKINDNLNLYGNLTYKNLKSKNFAQLNDLLGGSGYLDINPYNEGEAIQNNLQQKDRIVLKGDDFKYNYQVNINTLKSYLNLNFRKQKMNGNIGVFCEYKNYERKGFYENGQFPGSESLGNSELVKRNGVGLKLSTTYQINHKSQLSLNFLKQSLTPESQFVFINPRQSNAINPNLENENNTAFDLNYEYKFNGHKLRLSTYIVNSKNASNKTFFFTNDIANEGRVDNSDFFQEFTTNISTQNMGLELGTEIKINPTLKIQLSAALGNHRYTNNPNVSIIADGSSQALYEGITYLKNYKLATGPQNVMGLGFTYNDPNYWWFSSQLNYFSNTYISVSPYKRTANFGLDVDGQVFHNYDQNIANELLNQEQFDNYFTWNAIGGKSWKINKNYLGVTIGVQNILNTFYKTGGFEQGRNSNYQSLLEDQSRVLPLFGNKYWLGAGTTYYLNTYIRF